MHKIINNLCILLSLILFSGISSAVTVNWMADIDGSQEVPANRSIAIGQGIGTLDTVTGFINWDISWRGINATAMHFHGPAPPENNAGVRVDIGGISGLNSSSVGHTTISASDVGELLSDRWYINIHSAEFPGGEIRGQVNISVVPVPPAAWLFGSSLLWLVGMARGKKA